MSRSIWKGPFIEHVLLKKLIHASQATKKLRIKTWSRKSTIIAECCDKTFSVYNGLTFLPLTVTEDMINHKFGEFVPTRKKCIYKNKKNKKAKKAKTK